MYVSFYVKLDHAYAQMACETDAACLDSALPVSLD